MTTNGTPPAGECPGVEMVEGFVPHDMLEILVNGVFAFAMTLIVKNNIPLPTTVPTEDIAFLVRYLGTVVNEGIVFLFTFMILAVFYILFFEMMRHTRVVDRVVVLLTFGFILSILFIPLTSLATCGAMLPNLAASRTPLQPSAARFGGTELMPR